MTALACFNRLAHACVGGKSLPLMRRARERQHQSYDVRVRVHRGTRTTTRLLPHAIPRSSPQTPGLSPDTASFNARYGGVAAFDATAGAGASSSSSSPKLYFLNAAMDPLQFLSPSSSDAARGFTVLNYVGGQSTFSYAAFASAADPPSVVETRDTVYAFILQAVADAAAATVTTTAGPFLFDILALDVNDQTTQIVIGCFCGGVLLIVLLIVVVCVRRAKTRAKALAASAEKFGKTRGGHVPAASSSRPVTQITAVVVASPKATGRGAGAAGGGRGAPYRQ
jgi:hypothetical protein